MAWSLVCPANRGIGFHLTRHLLQATKLPIVATTRSDVSGTKKSILENLKGVDENRLNVLEVDVTDEATMKAASEEAKKLFPEDNHHLRLGFVIPGILQPEKNPSQLDHATLTKTFAVNTIGPLLMMKHFSGFLPKKATDLEAQTPGAEGIPKHAVWTTMSARVGSTTDNSLGGWYSYRASKAGVTSISKTLDLYLRNRSGENAMAIAYHPGTVKTGLSKEFWESVQLSMLLQPELAAEKMLQAVNEIGLDGRGKCWDWKGDEVLP